MLKKQNLVANVEKRKKRLVVVVVVGKERNN